MSIQQFFVLALGLAGVIFFVVLIVWVPRFIYRGIEATSTDLKGRNWIFFQCAVSVVVPILLSLFYLRNIDSSASYLTVFSGVTGRFYNVATFATLCVLTFVLVIGSRTYVDTRIRESYKEKNPQIFQLFVVPSLFIFVLLYFSYTEVTYRGSSSNSEIPLEAVKKMRIEKSDATGSYFGNYLYAITVHYFVVCQYLWTNKYMIDCWLKNKDD